jgi:hypothetical protein
LIATRRMVAIRQVDPACDISRFEGGTRPHRTSDDAASDVPITAEIA